MSYAVSGILIGFLLGFFVAAGASNYAADRAAKRGFATVGDQLFCRVIDPPGGVPPMTRDERIEAAMAAILRCVPFALHEATARRFAEGGKP